MRLLSVEELKHYGVKGMRWGHRKAARLARKNFQRGQRSLRSRAKQTLRAMKRDLAKQPLSDDELRRYREVLSVNRELSSKNLQNLSQVKAALDTLNSGAVLAKNISGLFGEKNVPKSHRIIRV